MLFTFDLQMLFGTAAGLSCGFLNSLLPAFTLTDSKGLIWLLCGFVLLLDKRTRRSGWMLLFSVALAYIIGDQVIKYLVARPRPFAEFGVSNLLIPTPDGYSFPSGHASSSFAALAVIYATNKKMRIPAAVYALLIAFSRVYLFVHFPSDVLAGVILGTLCAYLIMMVFNHFQIPRPLYES